MLTKRSFLGGFAAAVLTAGSAGTQEPSFEIIEFSASDELLVAYDVSSTSAFEAERAHHSLADEVRNRTSGIALSEETRAALEAEQERVDTSWEHLRGLYEGLEAVEQNILNAFYDALDGVGAQNPVMVVVQSHSYDEITFSEDQLRSVVEQSGVLANIVFVDADRYPVISYNHKPVEYQPGIFITRNQEDSNPYAGDYSSTQLAEFIGSMGELHAMLFDEELEPKFE